jgi:hypothetical protein
MGVRRQWVQPAAQQSEVGVAAALVPGDDGSMATKLVRVVLTAQSGRIGR